MNKKIILIVIPLLFVFYYMFQSPDSEKNNQVPVKNKPNVVSQAETPEIDPVEMQAEWDRKNKIKMDRLEQAWLSYLNGRKIETLDAEPTFLQAYRDYKYYDHCILVIGNILYEMNPVAAVLDVMHTKTDEVYELIAEIQKDMIRQRIEKCVSLTHFDDQLYYPESIQGSLKLRMESISPKSPDEIELAAVVSLVENFRRSVSSVERLKRGESIDHQLFSDLWRQKSELERQYPQRLSIFGGYADADMSLVNQLNEQIKTIEAQIEANKLYDKVSIKMEEENLKLLKAQIENKLFNVNSSDAYLAIQDLLKEPRYENELKAINRQIKQKLKLIPEKYSQILQPIVTQLRACELGHPCGPNSVFSEEKCLNFSDNNSEKACGTDILDYYLNHHLSPLELGDVEYLLEQGF